MPIDPTKTVQIKITAPKPIAEQLRAIAEARGMPLSQLLLQAAIDRYLNSADNLAQDSAAQ